MRRRQQAGEKETATKTATKRQASTPEDNLPNASTPESLPDDKTELLLLCSQRGIDASESDTVTKLKAKLTGNA